MILKSKFKQEITEKINARNLEVKRTVQEVIKKYENISVVAKKEISFHNRESNKTGGGPPPPELSGSTKMVQDTIGADSPVLAGISGAEPEEQHNTELSQQSPEKQLQHQQSANSTPNQPAVKTMQIQSSIATREEVLELQREVLQLQKTKLQLEIEKLKKEKKNQDLYNFILNNKLLQLQSEGKVTIAEIDE
ncbi:hypothetical protein G5714_004510 [Onychostoma macrolepis]|uniref:Uncharacterized protein n=2 Tax=Onychostoma macrolepis TaxID=369639 RepID=A0A7J6D4Y5_9TELE|nr:hypothetical protein G5714_004510 [Onychostoma macrolepis]